MSFAQFLVLYLLAGVGVALAAYAAAGAPGATRWFQAGTALVFWPLYVPLLLTRPARPVVVTPSSASTPRDELADAIGQVDRELEGALQSLDGWAEDVLARENGRLQELRGAWVAQAQRIRDMDRLLSRPDYASAGPADALASPSSRLVNSQQVIRQNIDRLKQVRDQTLRELVETLAWVRELVSMIHLARFTGAPASRAEELVAQIAAAVEGLSEVTWYNVRPIQAPASAGDNERRAMTPA
jgi:hypothetical protein